MKIVVIVLRAVRHNSLARAFLVASFAVASLSAPSLAAEPPVEFRADFETAWREIATTYAYFHVKATAWDKVPALYAADLARVATKDDFVRLLERVLEELYDPHAHLTVNLATSPRLIPSGTDLWAEWRCGSAVITQVRRDSNAQRGGIVPGSVVIAVNGVPVEDAVRARLGRSYPASEPGARDWALRAVLAGRRNSPRVLELREAGANRIVELDANDDFGGPWNEPLTHAEIEPGIGYIRVNDSLGDAGLVVAFDRTLARFRGTRGLILDLRNTPSGGNTTVARGILGRFVTDEQPYQKHVLPAEEREAGVRRSWLELVSPRGEFAYEKPVVVLVDRWTGSMGEGLAIGFDATRSGIVVGTPMAGLLGATYRIVLPETGVGINLPAERLYHVDGTPREEFQPASIDAGHVEERGDPFIAAALRLLAAAR